MPLTKMFEVAKGFNLVNPPVEFFQVLLGSDVIHVFFGSIVRKRS